MNKASKVFIKNIAINLGLLILSFLISIGLIFIASTGLIGSIISGSLIGGFIIFVIIFVLIRNYKEIKEEYKDE
ncbi:MAG: hypothetical protein ACP6IY_09570 [Promethearchaeia archaeon]